MKKHQELKQIIREANPEKFFHFYCPDCEGEVFNKDFKKVKCNKCEEIDKEPIRLADVLLALNPKIVKNVKGYLMCPDLTLKVITLWHWKDDDFDHQSKFTKQFLINLLTE
jgi:ribosomal protein S27E